MSQDPQGREQWNTQRWKAVNLVPGNYPELHEEEVLRSGCQHCCAVFWSRDHEEVSQILLLNDLENQEIKNELHWFLCPLRNSTRSHQAVEWEKNRWERKSCLTSRWRKEKLRILWKSWETVVCSC